MSEAKTRLNLFPWSLLCIFLISIFSGLAYNWEIGLSALLFGILCYIISLIGFILVVGPVLYWLIANNLATILNLPLAIQLTILIIGLANAIIFTIISMIIMIAVFKI